MSDHPHHFDVADKPRGAVVMCSIHDCIGMVVIDHGSGKPRPLTARERTEVTIRMWEDTIYVQAFSIIHGRERAVEKVRRIRGYE